MANYLPVLLVSVTTNSIPDDSSLSTLPRGQVDYLSHDWQEEDVWRSWRNMTRQKNEIANGMRLENASWRTWWKQRNKLKTVTPETLNWLKDSDVTWLYGPLHTAVDWTPPPKPTPDPTSVDKEIPNSAHDRLDLSMPATHPRHKPILKHRSISEFLTSDLPISPIFSPAESEEEDVTHSAAAYDWNRITDADARADHAEGGASTATEDSPRRPPLTHTKSDTHITRWGPNRAFRKDSPPRIDPPGYNYSATNLNSYFARPDDNGVPPKKKHISFNTFVEQCIAIEKPKKGTGSSRPNKSRTAADGVKWNGKTKGTRWDTYDDGYEEDEEDGSPDDDDEPTIWDGRCRSGSAIGSDSDSALEDDEEVGAYEDDDDDDDEDDEEEDDDGVIEMRPSTYSKRTPHPRSKSKSSIASSSSSASTSTTGSTPSSSPARKSRKPPPRTARRNSIYTAPLLQRRSSSGTGTEKDAQHHNHNLRVTIAPIAPTILKTGMGDHGVWGNGWAEGFGDDGSDDGMSGGAYVGGYSGDERVRIGSSGESGGGTPVELVYVPTFGSAYGGRMGRDTAEDEESSGPVMNKERNVGGDVYHYQPAFFSVGGPTSLNATSLSPDVPSAVAQKPSSPSVPTVVLSDAQEEDAYDYFGGPDLGEDFTRSRGRHPGRPAAGVRSSTDEGRKPIHRSSGGFGGEADNTRSRSRSRSMSRSRTPSPALSPAVLDASASAVPVPVPVPGRKGTPSTSPPSSSSLLSPPLRGRGPTPSSQQELHSRGRSSARTASSSSWSDRERGSTSSPIGSLSPDGSGVVVVGSSGSVNSGMGSGGVGSGVLGAAGVYANGRADREKERGRERTGKRLSRVLGVANGEAIGDEVGGAAVTSGLPSAPGLLRSSTVTSSSSSSSASSSVTIIPPQAAQLAESASIPIPTVVAEEDDTDREAEEDQRYKHLTPANSPVLNLSRGSSPMLGLSFDTKIAPLPVTPPHAAEPSTSYSISPPRVDTRPQSPRSPPSLPPSPASALDVTHASLPPPASSKATDGGESSLVGKIVSSAGAYLGLWHGPMA